jgi:hypothetical protein
VATAWTSMTNTAPTSDAVAWQRLGRVTSVAGLAAVVLILVPIVVGTRPEPTFDAAAAEFLTYYQSPHTPASQFRSFVLTVGLITFVWFVGALTTLLRRAEGETSWRSAIAMGSGVLCVALGLSGLGNEAAVAFRAGDLDHQIARYAFDQGQPAFPNGRVALGSFAVCCGWVIASTRFLPRWLGWLADRKRSRARTQPHQLDQPNLAAALPDVLAVGDHGGRAPPTPELPRRRPARLNPVSCNVIHPDRRATQRKCLHHRPQHSDHTLTLMLGHVVTGTLRRRSRKTRTDPGERAASRPACGRRAFDGRRDSMIGQDD